MKQNALLFSNWQSDSKKCSLLQEIQIVQYKNSMVIIAIQSFNLVLLIVKWLIVKTTNFSEID